MSCRCSVCRRFEPRCGGLARCKRCVKAMWERRKGTRGAVVRRWLVEVRRAAGLSLACAAFPGGTAGVSFSPACCPTSSASSSSSSSSPSSTSAAKWSVVSVPPSVHVSSGPLAFPAAASPPSAVSAQPFPRLKRWRTPWRRRSTLPPPPPPPAPASPPAPPTAAKVRPAPRRQLLVLLWKRKKRQAGNGSHAGGTPLKAPPTSVDAAPSSMGCVEKKGLVEQAFLRRWRSRERHEGGTALSPPSAASDRSDGGPAGSRLELCALPPRKARRLRSVSFDGTFDTRTPPSSFSPSALAASSTSAMAAASPSASSLASSSASASSSHPSQAVPLAGSAASSCAAMSPSRTLQSCQHCGCTCQMTETAADSGDGRSVERDGGGSLRKRGRSASVSAPKRSLPADVATLTPSSTTPTSMLTSSTSSSTSTSTTSSLSSYHSACFPSQVDVMTETSSPSGMESSREAEARAMAFPLMMAAGLVQEEQQRLEALERGRGGSPAKGERQEDGGEAGGGGKGERQGLEPEGMAWAEAEAAVVKSQQQQREVQCQLQTLLPSSVRGYLKWIRLGYAAGFVEVDGGTIVVHCRPGLPDVIRQRGGCLGKGSYRHFQKSLLRSFQNCKAVTFTDVQRSSDMVIAKSATIMMEREGEEP